MNTIEATVGDWPGIEVAPHRFNAREFTLHGREIGHLHGGRLLDVPFPRRVRDVLLAEDRAEKHHVLPDSGWVSYRVRSDEDVDGALWLLRVSYLYHLIAMGERDGGDSAADAVDGVAAIDVDAELAELDVSDELQHTFGDAKTAP